MCIERQRPHPSTKVVKEICHECLEQAVGIESTGITRNPVSSTTSFPNMRQPKVSHNKDESMRLPFYFNHTSHIRSLTSAFDKELVSN